MVFTRGTGPSCAAEGNPTPPLLDHGFTGACASRRWKSSSLGAPVTPACIGPFERKLEGSWMNAIHAAIVALIGSLFPLQALGSRVPSGKKPGS